MWTVNFQMFKLVLEKAEEPEIKLPTSPGSWEKQESSRKTSISALLTIAKPLTVWITINCGKFWKRWEYQTTWPASWETYMQVMKQQLGAGALGRPRGMVWGGRREEGSGWGTHVYLWQIHFDIWQNQYNIVKLKKKEKEPDMEKQTGSK